MYKYVNSNYTLYIDWKGVAENTLMLRVTLLRNATKIGLHIAIGTSLRTILHIYFVRFSVRVPLFLYGTNKIPPHSLVQP